jgi:hypothetical protein
MTYVCKVDDSENDVLSAVLTDTLLMSLSSKVLAEDASSVTDMQP